ncbi:MAG TPA: ABC transporter permease subunit [Myxococcales bacterium]
MNRVLPVIWGRASAGLGRSRRFGWIDLLVLVGIFAAAVGIIRTAEQWRQTLRPAVEIDLSIAALPKYTLLSLSRGLAAYVLSLGFSLAYGYWAAKDRIAERILIPILDILQSIPILGFMPGVVLALVAAFPRSNVGLELAAILLIFTGQAWNMTFSFYHSVRAVPSDQREAATVYRFSAWERFRWVELPFSAIGLVWNSMMSMAGGWFFLMISEAFVLGDKDFRLPGLGSYMSVAVAHGDRAAMLWAIAAMTAMILLLDQLLWRPVVVWAEKFRVEEGATEKAQRSWFLQWLRRSRILAVLSRAIERARARAHRAARPRTAKPPRAGPSIISRALSAGILLALAAAGVAGGWQLIQLLAPITPLEWKGTIGSALTTLVRVLVALAVGTAWTVPAGLAIGLSPRLSRLLQPVVQVLASFPAPMLFPAVIAVLAGAGVSLGWGSIVLMVLGTQWYILFNVIAGAMAIPADLREAARSYRFELPQRFARLYLPAVFPYLVTGWVTAAGGAWNASIVSEYVTFKGQVLSTYGLGAQISQAASAARFPLLAASVLVMSAVVVAFNRLVWKRCNDFAERRFSLSK